MIRFATIFVAFVLLLPIVSLVFPNWRSLCNKEHSETLLLVSERGNTYVFWKISKVFFRQHSKCFNAFCCCILGKGAMAERRILFRALGQTRYLKFVKGFFIAK